MEKIDTETVYKLMQTIVDKLEHIETELNTLKSNHSNSNTNKILEGIETTQNEVRGFIDRITNYIVKTNKEVSSLQESIPKSIQQSLKPSITTTHKHYSLIGKDAPISIKNVFLLFISITLLVGSIKYAPGAYLEHSTLKKDEKTYHMIYEYIFLNSYAKNKTTIQLEELQQKATSRNHEFIENLNALKLKYNNDLELKRLQKQVNLLKQ